MSKKRTGLLEETIKLAKKRNLGPEDSGGTGVSFRERMEIFREFRKFREDFPDMSKVQVIKLFPEFKVCVEL